MGSAAVQQHLFGPTPDPAQSQWFTADWLAERVVQWAGRRRTFDGPEGIAGKRVVELGAGDGAFVRPLLAAGAQVVAVERDPRFASVLGEKWRDHPGIEVIEGDALDPSRLEADTFDLYIGNPPYEDDADIAFIERGLELAPRVVVVLRLVSLAGQERWRRIWSQHELGGLALLPARPSFVGAASGNAKSDFAVFDIRRGRSAVFGGHDSPNVEWWP
jgi:predicted RNA methylase